LTPKKPVFEKEGVRVIVLEKSSALCVQREKKSFTGFLKFKKGKCAMYCM